MRQGARPNVALGFSREVVTGIFGQRGSGKSYTLGAIVEGLGTTDTDANIGHNVCDRAVLLLDTLNIYQYAAIQVSKIPDETVRKALSARLSGFGPLGKQRFQSGHSTRKVYDKASTRPDMHLSHWTPLSSAPKTTPIYSKSISSRIRQDIFS